MTSTQPQRAIVAYEVPDADESWELEEEDMPESAWHDAIIDLVKALLKAWASRTEIHALIASNLALRWDKSRWKIGVDPDLALYVPPPPEGDETSSVCTWEPGHSPPRIALEVVSKSTAAKDYVTAPDQYAASGTTELWVFDPKRYGPKQHGGPYRLQLWRRDERGVFRQLYRGDGPVQSPELGAWLVLTERGKRLRIADDADGQRLWPTGEELAEQQREHAQREQELAEQQRESAQREQERAQERATALEAELASLRAELERLRNR